MGKVTVNGIDVSNLDKMTINELNELHELTGLSFCFEDGFVNIIMEAEGC